MNPNAKEFVFNPTAAAWSPPASFSAAAAPIAAVPPQPPVAQQEPEVNGIV